MSPFANGVDLRAEPQAGDVAVHPQSPSYHALGHLDAEGVGYVAFADAQDELDLEPCVHCSPDGRRAVIQGGSR